jgi:acetyl-CoA synthetase
VSRARPSYREALGRFRWNDVLDELGWTGQPTVNLATTIVDRHARGSGGGRTALICIGQDGADRRVSFRELSEQSARFANVLTRLGVKKGDRVAALMPRVAETLAIILGVLKVGAVYVPIFAGFGPDAVRYRLQHSGARLLCTTDEHRALVPDDINVRTICLARSGACVRADDCDFDAELGERVIRAGALSAR